MIFKIYKSQIFFLRMTKCAMDHGPWTRPQKLSALIYILTYIWSKILFLGPLFVKDRFSCKQYKKFGIAGKANCLLECLSAISAKIQFIFTTFARNFIFDLLIPNSQECFILG